MHIFKWIAALAIELKKEELLQHLGLVMSLLQREVTLADNGNILGLVKIKCYIFF
jgi:hypothetical protein